MTTPKKPGADPFAAREAEKYAMPIASREHIMDVLRAHKKSVSLSALVELLGLDEPEQRVALKRRLRAMALAGQIGQRQKRYYTLDVDHWTVDAIVAEAVEKHQLCNDWPAETLKQAKSLPDHVVEADCQDREDLRHVPFVTIDGEDARDFDDAVYCEALEAGGWQLFVAIADVSHYVYPDSALDQEAMARGNSVYFPNCVLPMLPEALSNGLCSLRPKVDRLCMVCEMQISAFGGLDTYRFYPAIMHSQARLTYTEVAAWLKAGKASGPHAEVGPHVLRLYDCFQVLLKQRQERGALEIDSIETRLSINATGEVEDVVPVHRNDAHRLIEECMLMANVAAAKFLIKNQLPGVFRIHAEPNDEKIMDLRSMLSLRGMQLPNRRELSTKDLNDMLIEARSHADFQVIQTQVLRTLCLAVYSHDNIGHFGLAYPAYTHFTSPIRRYADLMVHRLIKSSLGCISGKWNWDEETLEAICEHISTTERQADEASRDVVGRLKAVYLSQHLGKPFDVVISGVLNFGFFATIPEWQIDGLVHVRTLKGDYFEYDEEHQVLLGQRSGVRYAIGDVVSIVVSRVDVQEGKIDFDLVEPEKQPEGKPKAKKRKYTVPKGVKRKRLKRKKS